MRTRFDYDRQAETYDATRAASPSVSGLLLAALENLPGRRVLDIGGGTGNYSAALASVGFDPVVADYNADMLVRAATKGLATVRADAAELPFPAASVDAAMFVSMLHHVPAWEQALEDGQRVVRPGGKVVLLAFGREHLAVHWVTSYLPRTTAHFAGSHQTMTELQGVLAGATVTPVRYTDLVDGSMAAMCRQPETLLDPEIRRQTSFFEHATTHEPDELRAGMTRLEADLAAGRRPQDEDPDRRARLGDAALFVWTADPDDRAF
ncbi:MAG: class I SAM-dependent methyltransferase [Acidimicrobiales bacterium]